MQTLSVISTTLELNVIETNEVHYGLRGLKTFGYRRRKMREIASMGYNYSNIHYSCEKEL
jgi:hypothetical protein